MAVVDALEAERTRDGAGGQSDNQQPLDRLEWAYESPCVVALEFDFAFRTTDYGLGVYLTQLVEPFLAPGSSSRCFSLVGSGPLSMRRYALYLDDQLLTTSADPVRPFSFLLSEVTQGVVETAADCLLLHAAGAEARGEAFVFPGPSGAGKTTLAAGLVRSGFGYVSDEVVAVDLNTLNIRPYPKALSIDKGSWGVLSDLEPSLGPELAMYAGPQWQVPAKAISPGVIAGLCVPCYLVALCYRPGPSSELVPLSRAEAVAVLAGNSFNFTQLGKRGLEALAEIAHRSSCYRLFVGDLEEASSLLHGLLAERNATDATG